MNREKLEEKIVKIIQHEDDCHVHFERDCNCRLPYLVKNILTAIDAYVAEHNTHIRTLIEATPKCVNDKCPCSETLGKILANIHPSATKEENTRKCPSCKSLNFYDKDGFLFECEDCGHIWNEDDEPEATHGKEGE